MSLWLFGKWDSMVLLPPLVVILATRQVGSKITLAGLAALYAISMLVTWNEDQTSYATAEAVAKQP